MSRRSWYGVRSSINCGRLIPPCPAGQVPDLRLEFVEGFWRDAPRSRLFCRPYASEKKGKRGKVTETTTGGPRTVST
jgi:hypothetical protein